MLDNDLLTRAIHEMNEACEKRSIDEIDLAIEHFQGALSYLPEKMPMYMLANKIREYNNLHAQYGDRPELFDDEHREFHLLLLNELNKRD